MYVCNHETGGGFFQGVCTPSTTTANLHDPPPTNSRINTIGYALAVFGEHDGS
jgi:hypothetical protein